ncbi:MAG TPA: ATP-binding protein [Vicinamibacterales bacterium]
MSFLRDGGVTGDLIRSIDWSQTTLGAIDSWPASLKTTVGTMLHSRHPMFLWWGPQLIQFYNDGYMPSFGQGKHPAAMGQRGADCWQEIWPIISPQIDDVMQRARASWNEDQLVPIFRNGGIEEVYWTYGYSPVFDETGKVGGTLVVCTETTPRVLSGRRLQTLRLLVDGTVLAATPRAVLEASAEIIGRERADVPFALIYASDPTLPAPMLVKAIGLDAASAARVVETVGDRLLECALDSTPRPLSAPVQDTDSPWPEPVSHVFVAPIASGPQRSASGYIVFGISPRLPFDAAYRDYLLQLAEGVSQAQTRVEALHIRAVMENERNNLLQQAPVATAMMTGPDHVFQLANPLYQQLVGRRDLIRRTFASAFPELQQTPLPGILDRVYRTGEPFVAHEMLVRFDRNADGMLADCYVTFSLEPLRNDTGDVYGMMVVAIDVTSEVSARQRLERAQSERETLLHEVQGANRAKDEFLAMLGHELRNPLAPILTALQLMRLRGVQGAEKERAVIERQVRHVVRLVDDLLDVSRIARGKIELKLEPVWLSEVVAKAIEMASPLMEQRRQRLTADVPGELVVQADPGRLAQVVANVLNNAAKYTEPGGAISVNATLEGSIVRLVVRDTGVGIDPAMLATVFDAFAQERQDSDRSQGGLGLGLAIVRSLVDAHGGTVMLTSQGKGTGTECVIELPSSSVRPARPSAVPEHHAAPVGGGLEVLLVDDNVDAADMLAESLRALGHHVRVAHDGVHALTIATDYVPDIALLDLGLPVIDGYEVAARLRLQPGWESVRTVALTGYGLQNDRERTRRAGFDGHLIKPIDVNDLDALLRALQP